MRRGPSHHQHPSLGMRAVGLAAVLAAAVILLVNLLDDETERNVALLTALHAPSSGGDPKAAAAVVRELLRLGGAGPSRRGNAHRSIICTMSRNDVHLREFVVRSLLAGVGHVVIYDNNQVESGFDMDVRGMLAPFVEAGAVTHVPCEQNRTKEVLIHSGHKEDFTADCVNRFSADWVMACDTDEMLYMEERRPEGEGVAATRGEEEGAVEPQGARPAVIRRAEVTTPVVGAGEQVVTTGVLTRFLDALEERGPHICSVHFPWRMMYGEHRTTTTPNQLLLDAYPRVCKNSWLPKLIFRPEMTRLTGLPHGVDCSNAGGAQLGSDDADAVALLPEFLPHSHLMHYYQKSVEEWLPKMEQSMMPYVRYMPASYDGKECSKTPAAIAPAHAEQVRAFMARLRALDPATPDGGHRLGRMPEFGREAFDDAGAGGAKAYELYLFMKVRVLQREEWDEERYLADHPAVAAGVAQGEWVDGFQQFVLEGFASMNGPNEAAGYFSRPASSSSDDAMMRSALATPVDGI